MKKAVLTICSTIALSVALTTAYGGRDYKGNMLPKIKGYQLRINAYAICPGTGNETKNTGDKFDDTSRKQIAVEAIGLGSTADGADFGHPDASNRNNIDLTSSSVGAIEVKDGNACDGDPAELILPDDVADTFTVYIRLSGKMGGAIDPVLCGDYDSNTYCQSGSTIRTRTNKFQDRTRELLYIDANLVNGGDNDCTGGKCKLFTDLTSEFWDWSADDKAHATVVLVPQVVGP